MVSNRISSRVRSMADCMAGRSLEFRDSEAQAVSPPGTRLQEQTELQSAMQFREIAIIVKRLRIGESFYILDIAPVHNVADGDFGDLAGFGAGDVWNLQNEPWHMARTGARADLRFDL